jgi:hypothetical protein
MKKTSVDYTPAVLMVKAAARAKSRWGVAHVFNDRLKSGGRSIKAWGKDRKFYLPIKRKLERMGYTVKLKNIGQNRYRDDGQDCYRIHVI